MSTYKQFEDLEVWQSAIELAEEIYILCWNSQELKKDFSAMDNIKRAATSVSNNIAEGFEYNSNRQFIRFLKFSKGSAGETRSQLHLFKRINYITHEEHKCLTEKCMNISKSISGFIKYLTTSGK